MNYICLFINQTIRRKQSKVGMFGIRMEGGGEFNERTQKILMKESYANINSRQ